jgi:predicted enzyme related to lactoylglutathione lyase
MGPRLGCSRLIQLNDRGLWRVFRLCPGDRFGRSIIDNRAVEVPVSKIVHFEIPVDDVTRATRFYRDALHWDIVSFGDEPYWLVRAGADDEPGANGALLLRDELHRSPIVTAGVDDMDAALLRVESSGGKMLQGKLPIPSVGWSAYVADSEGNTIGLLQQDAQAAAHA